MVLAKEVGYDNTMKVFTAVDESLSARACWKQSHIKSLFLYSLSLPLQPLSHLLSSLQSSSPGFLPSLPPLCSLCRLPSVQ